MVYSVAIIDDDPLIRMNLSHAIKASDDLRVAGMADDIPEGIALLDATKPDVALIDMDLPSGSGLDLIHYAAEKLPQCGIMVVTIFAEESLVIKCIEAGATGYLLKGASTEDITKQIHSLIAGGSPLSPPIARKLLKRFAVKSPTTEETVELSAQEQLVLQMSAKGYTYDEIAKVMNLSRHTVGTYVKRLYNKLQVHSKAEALFEARNRGMAID